MALVQYENRSTCAGASYFANVSYTNGTQISAASGTTSGTGYANPTLYLVTGANVYFNASKTITGAQTQTLELNHTITAAEVTATIVDLGTLNLSTPGATCTDGYLNGAETLIDCGGSCGACVAASAASVSYSTTAANATGTLTVSSAASASGGTPAILITLVKGNLTSTTNGSDVISTSNYWLNTSSIVLTKGASNVVLLTVYIPDGTSATYNGTITVANNMSIANTSSTVTISVQTAGGVRRSNHMTLTVTGVEPTKYCLNEPVLVTVTSDSTGKALDSVDIDVYLGKEKLFNLNTDKNGQATFTPTKVGDYVVNGQRARYREKELTIKVIDCMLVTTTIKENVTTTVKEEVTTTVAEVTTTVAEVTTTVKPVTTVEGPVTTIPVAPAKKFPWSTVIIVIVVIVIIAAVLMSKKGKAAPAAVPKESKPAAGK